MLLSCYGIATYRTFKGLITPAKPANKTFGDLVILMKNYQTLKEIL